MSQKTKIKKENKIKREREREKEREAYYHLSYYEFVQMNIVTRTL